MSLVRAISLISVTGAVVSITLPAPLLLSVADAELPAVSVTDAVTE